MAKVMRAAGLVGERVRAARVKVEGAEKVLLHGAGGLVRDGVATFSREGPQAAFSAYDPMC